MGSITFMEADFLLCFTIKVNTTKNIRRIINKRRDETTAPLIIIVLSLVVVDELLCFMLARVLIDSSVIVTVLALVAGMPVTFLIIFTLSVAVTVTSSQYRVLSDSRLVSGSQLPTTMESIGMAEDVSLL